MDELSKKRAVERMRVDLWYVESHRKRANALDNLGMLLKCETPGTVSEVGVAGSRWRFWDRGKSGDVSTEIVLSDEERREFADWCKERAGSLRDRADQVEVRYANGGE